MFDSSNWFNIFERSVLWEHKHHCANVRGQQYPFAGFIQIHLEEYEHQQGSSKALSRLKNIYMLYPNSSVAERRRYLEETQGLLAVLKKPGKVKAVVSEQIRQAVATEKPTDWRDTPVDQLRGVGPVMRQHLARVGITTIGGLLTYYPRKHIDYSKCQRIRQLKAGEHASIWGIIYRTESYKLPGKDRLTVISVTVRDSSGSLKVNWFFRGTNHHLQQQYKKRFPAGAQVLMSGLVKYDKYTKKLTLEKPEAEVFAEVEDLESLNSQQLLHVGRIVPIYPLTDGLNGKWLRQAMRAALEQWLPKHQEILPPALLQAYGLLSWPAAIAEYHFPSDPQKLAQARNRLVFEELLLTQLAMRYKRKQREQLEDPLPFNANGLGEARLLHRFLASLPFQLTGAQKRVYEEIHQDLLRPEPMSRLVQGDVGSGKTVVAILSLLMALENGYQGALMAPTEILAEQHYHKMMQWLLPLGVQVELLLGSQGVKVRRQARERLLNGEAALAVGTHALIQEGVVFRNLGLAIIDEQHRFGVKQRMMLKEKGQNPEVLTMTATPIPRTLAHALYADLDVSIIDELPPGRQPIDTRFLRGHGRYRQVWDLMRAELTAGRQCYVVFPLVEESEKLDLKAAVSEYERYQQELFPEFRVGLLHGKMKSQEKEATMRAFVRHDLDILVATTVIEVGVDVPNASVMVIEHAERFGLAQLHQLRGRVGRGTEHSYCLLLADKPSEQVQERLAFFTENADGFKIAEKDLEMRGPGEFMGTRQSGIPDLVLTDLAHDTAQLEMARTCAAEILDSDPALEQFQHQGLRRDMWRFFRDHMDFLDA